MGKVLKLRDRVGGMVEMLKLLGLELEGKHHSGIDDARNISRICLELIKTHKAMFYKT